MSDILAGNIGALASKVEGVLARGIPIVLDFLASMIGFGSKIVEVIQKALDAIRAPIQKAIDALLMAIKNALAGFIAKLKGAFGKKKGKDGKKGDEKFDGEIGERLSFSADGEQHSIWVNTSGARPVVMMASSPRPLSVHLQEFRKKADDLGNSEDASQAKSLIGQAASEETAVAQKAAEAKRAKDTKSDELKDADDATEAAQAKLKGTLESLLKVLGIEIPEEVKPQVVINFKYPAKLKANVTPAERAAGYSRNHFRLQLKRQEKGINDLMASAWRTNRDNFEKRKAGGESGRDPIAAELQKTFRRKQEAAMIQALEAGDDDRDMSGLKPAARAFVNRHKVKDGLSETTAGDLVRAWLKKQAALHDPDQIAGGNPDGLTDLGSGRLNSSIGSQWGNGLADTLDTGTNSRLEGVPRPLWDKVKIKKTSAGGVVLKV